MLRRNDETPAAMVDAPQTYPAEYETDPCASAEPVSHLAALNLRSFAITCSTRATAQIEQLKLTFHGDLSLLLLGLVAAIAVKLI